MKRYALVLIGIISVLIEQWLRARSRDTGIMLKKLSNYFLNKWKDTDGWNYKLFLRCYMVDIEIHFSGTRTVPGGVVMRGPLYALFPSMQQPRTLCAKLNWVAERRTFTTEWRYDDERELLLRGYAKLHMLPNGDCWFTFDGGHAVIFLGTPLTRLAYAGGMHIKRVYQYF